MVPMIGVANGWGDTVPVMHVHVDLLHAAFGSYSSMGSDMVSLVCSRML